MKEIDQHLGQNHRQFHDCYLLHYFGKFSNKQFLSNSVFSCCFPFHFSHKVKFYLCSQMKVLQILSSSDVFPSFPSFYFSWRWGFTTQELLNKGKTVQLSTAHHCHLASYRVWKLCVDLVFHRKKRQHATKAACFFSPVAFTMNTGFNLQAYCMVVLV